MTCAVGEHGAARVLHAELHRVADRYGCVDEPCRFSAEAAEILRLMEAAHRCDALTCGAHPSTPAPSHARDTEACRG